MRDTIYDEPGESESESESRANGDPFNLHVRREISLTVYSIQLFPLHSSFAEFGSGIFRRAAGWARSWRCASFLPFILFPPFFFSCSGARSSISCYHSSSRRGLILTSMHLLQPGRGKNICRCSTTSTGSPSRRSWALATKTWSGLSFAFNFPCLPGQKTLKLTCNSTKNTDFFVGTLALLW